MASDEQKRMTDHELAGLLLDVKQDHRLYQGSVWRHKKTGTEYVVVGVVLKEDDLTPLVSYSPVSFPERSWLIWARPALEFVERFEMTRV